MASSQVLSAQQSQVVGNLTITTAGAAGAINKFILHPRIGPSQIMTLSMTTVGPTDTVNFELEIIYHDEAFEGQDMFGGKKGKGPRQAESKDTI
jgi:hypothetical protein